MVSVVAQRILVVEGDEALGEVVTELLGRNGYTILSARTVHEATECAQRGPVEAVILDVDTVSPQRAARWFGVWQEEPVVPPVILLGVHAEDLARADVLRHSETRAVRHLQWIRKPFRKEELLSAVRVAVRPQPSTSNLS